MKRGLIFLTVVTALLFLAAVDVWGPSKAPPNQRPLLTLSPANFSEFVTGFDGAADGPRIVLLLSPT